MEVRLEKKVFPVWFTMERGAVKIPGWFHSHQLKDGRYNIQVAPHLTVTPAAIKPAGKMKHHEDTQSPIGKHPLHSGEGRTMVCRCNDEGILLQTRLTQGIKDRTTTPVKGHQTRCKGMYIPAMFLCHRQLGKGAKGTFRNLQVELGKGAMGWKESRIKKEGGIVGTVIFQEVNGMMCCDFQGTVLRQDPVITDLFHITRRWIAHMLETAKDGLIASRSQSVHKVLPVVPEAKTEMRQAHHAILEGIFSREQGGATGGTGRRDTKGFGEIDPFSCQGGKVGAGHCPPGEIRGAAGIMAMKIEDIWGSHGRFSGRGAEFLSTSIQLAGEAVGNLKPFSSEGFVQHKPPNILLITTDQQRHDTVGAGAPKFLRTPHLAHLAREGITYRRAYSDCPICVPARVSIMSGKKYFEHRMVRNGHTNEVLGTRDTLPALLAARGYQSCAVGKMHFTPERHRHGFEEMILPADYYRMMETSGHPLQPMRHGMGQNEIYPCTATVPEAMTLTSWTAEKSVEFLMRRRDPLAPFFLWTSFSKPHPPFDPPPPYDTMYNSEDIPPAIHSPWSGDDTCPTPFWRRRVHQSYDLVPPGVIRAARAVYYGLVTQIDHHIGRLFAALQDSGQMDNTLILFTSDHGELLGDHHSAGKTFFYEGSSRIPFILRPPRGTLDDQRGDIRDELVTLADILPTLVGVGGGDFPGVLTSRNLLDVNTPPPTHIEGGGIDAYVAITDGQWKYIYYPEGAAEQLFDLVNDPRECNNLASIESDKKQELRGELLRRMRQRSDPLLDGDDFLKLPANREPEKLLRSRGFPGFVTEWTPADIRH